MASYELKSWDKSFPASSYFDNSGSFSNFKPSNYESFSDFSKAFKPDYSDKGEGKGKDAYSFFSGLFDKAREANKYQSMADKYGEDRDKENKFQSGYGGGFQGGGGAEAFPGFYIRESPKMAPVFFPGVEGKKGGLFGQIGGLAGALGSAFNIFGPLGAPIGAAVGGLIDTATG